MGERKGQNLYYPPDFDPQKHRNLAGYTGQHPLRERAKKLAQGILVIRFEMPYNIWCGGCNSHIGMGVRYNAEKSKVGMYYTTPIYKFRMKCHLCNNYFEIKTDPAGHDYVIISGARRKEQRWDPKENEQIVPEDKESQKKFAQDAMFKLEHGVGDKGKSKASKSTLAQLESQQAAMKDDFYLNKLARSKFRMEKKAMKDYCDTEEALLIKSSLDIELVEENEDDVKLAELMHFNATQSYDEKQMEKRQAIQGRSLFSHGQTIDRHLSSSSSSSSSSPSPFSAHHKQLVAKQMIGQIVKNCKRKELAGRGFQDKHDQNVLLSKASSALVGIVRKPSATPTAVDNVDDGGSGASETRGSMLVAEYSDSDSHHTSGSTSDSDSDHTSDSNAFSTPIHPTCVPANTNDTSLVTEDAVLSRDHTADSHTTTALCLPPDVILPPNVSLAGQVETSSLILCNYSSSSGSDDD